MATLKAALRRELYLEQYLPIQVAQAGRQRARARVYAQHAEELQPVARRPVSLHAVRDPLEPHFRAEGAIERAGAERARVQRAGDEFPERREVAEGGA